MLRKKIAIITGASGGLGSAFVSQLIHTEIDELWCIARDLDKLNHLKTKFGNKIVLVALDLTQATSISILNQRLSREKPNIIYLINNAGMGDIIASYQTAEPTKSKATVDLNCTAIVLMCTTCLPYMQSNAKILNVSSQASFQPLPYVNLYAATKAFVTSYTRALNVELKQTGITATAVCPGWIDTELLPKTKNELQVKYPHIIQPQQVAIKALNDARKHKDMSVITLYVKWLRLLTKLFPHKMVMKIWVYRIKKYL